MGTMLELFQGVGLHDESREQEFTVGVTHQSLVSRITAAHAATTRPAPPTIPASVSLRPAPSLGKRAASASAVVFVIVTRLFVASKKRFEMANFSVAASVMSSYKGGNSQAPPPTSHSALCSPLASQLC